MSGVDRKLIPTLLLLALLALPSLAQVCVIPAPQGFGADAPAVAADGHGLLAVAAFGDYRLRRVDRALVPTDAVVAVPVPRPFAKIFHNELLAVDGGFLLVSEDGVGPVFATPLDAEGQARGAAVDLGGLTSFGVHAAHNGGAVVATYGSIFPTPFAYVRALETDGDPRSEWTRIAPKRIASLFDLLAGDVLQVAVSAIDEGFIAAWVDQTGGLFLRDVDREGTPIGPTVSVVADEACPHHVASASAAGREQVVFSAGCDVRRLYLALRTPGARAASQPRLLETLPPAPWGGDFHALGLAAQDERLGLVALVDRPDAGPGWVFYEFDLLGQPLSPPLDLQKEFGAAEVRKANVDLDPFTGRFVLSWIGDGAEGAGLYLAYP